MDQTRVLLWGLGEIGQRAARMLLDRPHITIVGAVSHQVGQDLGTALGRAPLGLRIVSEPQDLGPIRADICLLATHQRVPNVKPQVDWLLDAGISVIASGEEMICPAATHPGLAAEIDAKARAVGRHVYGTGINPGFVMDALPLCLSSVCARIDLVEVTRNSDFSSYGPGPLRSLGIGLSPAQFAEKLRDGTVDGHIGFRESIAVLAGALDWAVDEIREHQGRAQDATCDRVAGGRGRLPPLG
jgi:4-hydroxy-tetrahydrodipicolinate reductase